MYAVSNGKTLAYKIKDANMAWKTITIKRITVKAGKLEIGFNAEANANAFCYVDDVTVVKLK
jgi:hypothetical protein